MKQREKSVSPKTEPHGPNRNPMEQEFGAKDDDGGGEEEEDAAQINEYEEFAKKYEQFKVQVEQHLDGEHLETIKRDAPVLKTPESLPRNNGRSTSQHIFHTRRGASIVLQPEQSEVNIRARGERQYWYPTLKQEPTAQ